MHACVCTCVWAGAHPQHNSSPATWSTNVISATDHTTRGGRMITLFIHLLTQPPALKSNLRRHFRLDFVARFSDHYVSALVQILAGMAVSASRACVMYAVGNLGQPWIPIIANCVRFHISNVFATFTSRTDDNTYKTHARNRRICIAFANNKDRSQTAHPFTQASIHPSIHSCMRHANSSARPMHSAYLQTLGLPARLAVEYVLPGQLLDGEALAEQLADILLRERKWRR